MLLSNFIKGYTIVNLKCSFQDWALIENYVSETCFCFCESYIIKIDKAASNKFWNCIWRNSERLCPSETSKIYFYTQMIFRWSTNLPWFFPKTLGCKFIFWNFYLKEVFPWNKFENFITNLVKLFKLIPKAFSRQ